MRDTHLYSSVPDYARYPLSVIVYRFPTRYPLQENVSPISKVTKDMNNAPVHLNAYTLKNSAP